MNGGNPQGAISLEDLNNLDSANNSGDTSPADSFSVASEIQMAQAPTQQLDEETLAKIRALSDNAALDNPNITGGVQTAETINEAAASMPESMQSGGAIDLTALAEMPDAAFEQPKTNDTPSAPSPEATGTPENAEPASKTDEEIAAESEANRAQTEAGLAEASSSMQEMHQNIMAGVKKKEDLAIKASISSKSRRNGKKLSKKTKVIIGSVMGVAVVTGVMAFLFISGLIFERTYEVGDWTLRIDTSKYTANNESDVLVVADKEGRYQIRFTDIGSANYKNLLRDESGMKTVFAEQMLRYDGSAEEDFNNISCAVYRLTNRNGYDKMIYSAYCNKGDYMINIYATNNDNSRKEDVSREALEAAAQIANSAVRREQQQN